MHHRSPVLRHSSQQVCKLEVTYLNRKLESDRAKWRTDEEGARESETLQVMHSFPMHNSLPRARIPWRKRFDVGSPPPKSAIPNFGPLTTAKRFARFESANRSQ